jgi:hypothetical protein
MVTTTASKGMDAFCFSTPRKTIMARVTKLLLGVGIQVNNFHAHLVAIISFIIALSASLAL